MRSGEVVRLDRGHLDLAAGRIRIIATKFNKSRELALHPTTVETLDTYCRSVTDSGHSQSRRSSSCPLGAAG